MNIFLTLAGLLLYANYGLTGLAWLLAVSLGSYLIGRITPKYRWSFWLWIGVQILALLVLRFQQDWGGSLLAPMGVSYFTLRVLSYNIDVYRGAAPEKDPWKLTLYITYFPSLFLGPIETLDQFSQSLAERKFSWDGAMNGGLRILWGAFKKLVIATRAGLLISAIRDGGSGGIAALLAMMTYSVQLYADFSGGIDMVLGVSRILGLKLSENFNTPFFSETIGEFWRRWHITLGKWLTKYVYIPLGGSRNGRVRTVISTVVTFLVSGIWHGRTYLLWGLFHGLLVAAGRYLPKGPCPRLRKIRTFLLVSLLWSFYIWPTTAQALEMLGSVFTQFNYGALVEALSALGLGDWIVYLAACGILWCFDLGQDAIASRIRAMAPWQKVAVAGILGLVVLTFGMYGIGFVSEAFIYSKF